MRTLFLFVLFFYIKDSKSFRSDYNYHSDAKGWLKLHQIPATFHDAWLRCYLEGAVLASPSNPLIESAMRKEMSNTPVPTVGVFTGIHATFSNGDFFSIKGIPLNNMRMQWTPNEPDNKNNNEECILYNEDKTIADIGCSETHPYICYKNRTPNMVVTECGTIDPEYKLDTQTGKCYKFHTVVRNWTRAFMTCSAEGGHLAIINNETELKVIRKLYDNNASKVIKNENPIYVKDSIHVGIHTWNEIGVWATIHGDSLIKAGFEVWASGEPNNVHPGEPCVSMWMNQEALNDLACYCLLPFICEKSPKSLQNFEDNIMVR